MDWTYQTSRALGRPRRAALYVALLIAFAALALAFRLFLAAPPEKRAALASESQVAVIWEAWHVLENTAGTAGLPEKQVAADAVRAMALAVRENPADFSKRLESLKRRPPSSVPSGLADVWRAWQLLRVEHPEMPVKDLADAAILGLASGTGDPATHYLEVPQYEEARGYFEGDTYEGIGAWVDETDEGIVISETFVGGPGEAAGLRRGDRILAVNGHSTEGLTHEEVVTLIKGPRGTQVELRVQGSEDPQPRTVVATRELIPGPSLLSDIYSNEIGYIQLFRFHQTTGEEFRRTLQSLLDQGIQGLILDLRNNPGGSLRGATAVASQFLSDGIVLYEIGNTGERQDWKVEADGIAPHLPLVVIVNGASASAAEIVAGALQDAGRA
ncbi:MAG: PDZ domain-containing protein, partial [Chloroflexi bacterium]|nr:PDZ domain-containing protein [Chloroflexota bacterium]